LVPLPALPAFDRPSTYPASAGGSLGAPGQPRGLAKKYRLLARTENPSGGEIFNPKNKPRKLPPYFGVWLLVGLPVSGFFLWAFLTPRLATLPLVGALFKGGESAAIAEGPRSLALEPPSAILTTASSSPPPAAPNQSGSSGLSLNTRSSATGDETTAGKLPPPGGGLPDSASAPGKPAAVLQRPAPSDSFEAFITSLRISGVIPHANLRAVINGKVYHGGDTLEAELGIRLVDVKPSERKLVFEEASTAQIEVPY